MLAPLDCPRCHGMPSHLDDGCVRCDDVGRVPVEPIEAPVQRLPVGLHGAAAAALEAVMRRHEVPRRHALAWTLASALAAPPRGADPVRLGRAFGLDLDAARGVVEAYVVACREHASALRAEADREGRLGRPWPCAEREDEARACDAHADRIERRVP